MENEVLRTIRQRQSVRQFSAKEVPLPLLLELLEAADRAPSGFNLQPWSFVVVTDEKLRGLLCHAAMGQQQVRTAPATIVFVSDPHCSGKRFERILQMGLVSGALNAPRVNLYRNSVRASFQLGPFGIMGFLKRLAVPFMRLKAPLPNPLTSFREVGEYVCRQTIFAAQTFMLAAESVGLATVPMEGFDEGRVKKLLKIPRSMRIPLIIVVGYKAPDLFVPLTPRLDLTEKVSLNQFPNKLARPV